MEQEQIAAKQAAAAVLLNVNPDRIWICRVTGDVWLDDRPVKRMEFLILCLKLCIVEMLGWADNRGATAAACRYPTVERMIRSTDLIGAAGLALHLRGTA